MKNTFGFTNRESRGFVLLLPALMVLYAVPLVHSKIVERKKHFEYDSYLMKMDSLESAGWNRVNVSYTNQDSSKSKSSYQRRNQPKFNKILFDEADSIVLQIVPGIGQATAGRIIKFRDAIGGMYQKEQLLDVYGMTPEVLERVFEYFEFRPGIKTKININTADVGMLASHPYINYGSAKVIVAYRDQHGFYTSSDELLKVRIFTQEWIEKIKPYLTY
ncbi:helix-hairpin-helix domain-containing protein [Belliella sp. R4-6]|uniref:Helix-hairpin-helix domain-containing protein n=1 Tax=Belliella alkalica TaxID=1730871 RepID=A0ABS9VDC0_9BACT|nr:helix-hairpin-helix domain-containing protein [Belliella alkalica]MCH7414440.1 helix-hairpin-helix domain-containing protein [Belliella alkalica]